MFDGRIWEQGCRCSYHVRRILKDAPLLKMPVACRTQVAMLMKMTRMKEIGSVLTLYVTDYSYIHVIYAVQ